LTGVDRVGEQLVDMSTGERPATTLGAVCCRAAHRPQSEAVGLLLDPAHAAEMAIERKQGTHGLGLGRRDGEPSIAHVIAQGYQTAHPHPLRFEAAILSRMRSPVTSRSNWAKDSSTLRVSRPIELVVLNCCVTETNDTPSLSKISTSRAKSASAGVSRSPL